MRLVTPPASLRSRKNLDCVGNEWLHGRRHRADWLFQMFSALLVVVVVLSWDANTESDLKDYLVYRDGELVAEVPKGTTEWTDTSGGSIYFIRARNLALQVSSNSNVVIVGSVTIY